MDFFVSYQGNHASTDKADKQAWFASYEIQQVEIPQKISLEDAISPPAPQFIAAPSSTDASSTQTIQRSFHPIKTEWAKDDEKRYRHLVRLESLGRISTQETQELNRLQGLRRQLHHPRTADEIAWSYKQRRVTHVLITALQSYVTFHTTKSEEGKAPKR